MKFSLASAATALFVSFGLVATPSLAAAGNDTRGGSQKGSTIQTTSQVTTNLAWTAPNADSTETLAPVLPDTTAVNMAGTWVWAEYPKTDGTPLDLELKDGSTGGYYAAFAPEKVVAFAIDKQLAQISLWVPQDIAAALAKGQRPKTRAYLTNVLTQAHAAGLQVLALTDSYHWLNTTGAPNPSSFLSRPDLAAQWIADIAKTGLPFDGVRLDVETGAARAWVETSPGTTKTIAELYLEFAQLTSLAANLHGLPLTLDVDAALGELHVAAGSVAHLLVGALNPTT
ncbi:MAG: hypothetical protein FWG25_11745, partial [Promicromonosporaceae bacterium]|nr:hypothetical protein [Promicromonosporaceae bacterium]